MKKTIVIVSIFIITVFWGATAQAKVDCDNQKNSGPMKSKMCEVLNAEESLVDELGDYVSNACPQGNNSDSCKSLKMRHGNLQNAHGRAYE